ncbi:hypothetical protein DEO72_LG9g259 [Vigna unguiculata]|uniref:Uncharacterized protein n=1 Tax=Vigna unguiculata TaxID=3917 RepID=A0A4D6MUW5_VIGUN|nr:hypothetical protein DEO72_LG9g259 [Vigna unguiculata]
MNGLGTIVSTPVRTRFTSYILESPLEDCVPLFRVKLVSGCFASLFQVRTVADTDSLAQASLTRPGEMCRGSPRAFCASGRSGNQGVFLSEHTTRPGERGLA